MTTKQHQLIQAVAVAVIAGFIADAIKNKIKHGKWMKENA